MGTSYIIFHAIPITFSFSIIQLLFLILFLLYPSWRMSYLEPKMSTPQHSMKCLQFQFGHHLLLWFPTNLDILCWPWYLGFHLDRMKNHKNNTFLISQSKVRARNLYSIFSVSLSNIARILYMQHKLFPQSFNFSTSLDYASSCNFSFVPCT